MNILFATNPKMAGKTIKATVEIEGVCEECLKIASAEAVLTETKTVKKKMMFCKTKEKTRSHFG